MYMKYKEIKDKKQKDLNDLFTVCGVFWAFSNDQFKKGLDQLIKNKQLEPKDKITSIGAGGFIPSKNVDALIKGQKKIDQAFKKAIKDAKARQEHIIYELNNHEAFYTGEIEDTLDALGSDYTYNEVKNTYKEYKKAKYKQNLSINEIQAKYV